MADFVTLKYKSVADVEAIVAALPASNPLSKFEPGAKLYMSDFGLRELLRRAGQSVYMEPWDGASGVVNIEDILLKVPAALDANKGRIKFLLSDEVQASITFGKLKKLLDAGIFENEGFASYP